MATRDLYEVLGIKRAADADEVRRAYRKLARELHPDVNKASDAAKKFAEVQAAYEVLSDPKKKASYDTYGSTDSPSERGPSAGRDGTYSWSNVGAGGANGNAPRGGPQNPFGGMGGGFSADGEDLGSIFEAIFGGQGGRTEGESRAGTGGGPSRSGGRKSSSRGSRAKPAREAVEESIRVPFLTAAKGGTEQVRVTQEGLSRTIEVKIPAGTNAGAQLRVRGGAAARGTGADLVLTVHTDAHPLFRRGEFLETGRGLDIYIDVPVTIAEATLGGAVQVPTLDDEVELRIPPGSPSGRKLRLRGKGITDTAGTVGDLFVVVKIVPPPVETLSDSEKAALREISARGPFPRGGPEWPSVQP